MLLQPTSIGTLIAVMGQTVASYGVDPEPIFERVALDPAAAAVPGARVDLRRINRVWNLVREATGDPRIGLRVSQFIRPAHFHALGLSWLASRTAEGGLERLVRYHEVLTMACDLTLEQDDDESRLVMVHPCGIEMTSEAIDAFFGAVVGLSRMLAGPQFSPRRVQLRRVNPGKPEEYEACLGAPVRFSQPGDLMAFDNRDLRRPVPGGNESLAEETAKIAERYLAALHSSPTVERVRGALIELLPAGKSGLQDVARWMHTSVSTLRRNLKDEGAGYRGVLEETRRTLAEGYVGEKKHSLGEVAFLLGFNEQASFSRAFRRWTGKTPRRYRSEATGA